MKNIVILGGGFGGVSVATGLLKQLGKTDIAKVTLIEQNDSFCFNVASLRATVEPGFAKSIFIPFTKLFPDPEVGSFVQATVESVSANSVTIRKPLATEAEEIAFDYLVVALGSTNPFPAKIGYYGTKESALSKYDQLVELIRKESNKKILVIGGGPVGVELAGEIATDYPSKSVTLIHYDSKLLSSSLPDKFRDRVMHKLAAKKVTILLDDHIDISDPSEFSEFKERTLTTHEGKTIESDIQFLCIGFKVNSKPLESLPPVGSEPLFNSHGQIKVNEYLQVTGYKNIFALGDVCDSPGIKLAYRAGEEGALLSSNLVEILKAGDAESKKLKANTEGSLMMALSLGRNDGLVLTPWFTMPGWVTALLKSKGMFVSKYWSLLGFAKVQTDV